MTTRSTPAAVAVSFVASLLIGVSVSSSASAQVVSAYGAPNPGAPQELSEFAFLIGKWHAQGRTLQDDGTWKEPVMVWTFRYILDGYAIAGVFEEQGEDGELTSAGMDFRFYNRDQDRWTIEYFVPRVSFLMSQAQEDVGGVQASDTSVTVVRPLTSPPACSETICRGAGCGREQPTRLQSSWCKSSRVNCPSRTRSDATSRNG